MKYTFNLQVTLKAWHDSPKSKTRTSWGEPEETGASVYDLSKFSQFVFRVVVKDFWVAHYPHRVFLF